jgi:hypothetical protein
MYGRIGVLYGFAILIGYSMFGIAAGIALVLIAHGVGLA